MTVHLTIMMIILQLITASIMYVRLLMCIHRKTIEGYSQQHINLF